MLDSKSTYKELQPELEKLDEKRLKYYKRVEPFKYSFWITFIMGGFFILFNLNFAEDTSQMLYILYGVLTIVSLIAFIVAYFYNQNQFKKLFVDQVAPKIVKCLGPSFTYQYDGEVPVEIIKNSLLFRDFNRYDCQDLVQGELDQTQITFAELNLIRKSHSGNNQNNSETVFSGIYFQANIKLNFPTHIWLVPKFQFKVFWLDDRERLKLNHPATKPYRIYTYDKELAEKVLQPFILERIAAVNKKLKASGIARSGIIYHFGGHSVQAAIATRNRFLEPKLNQTIDSPAFVDRQIILLNTLSTLLKDLTLK